MEGDGSLRGRRLVGDRRRGKGGERERVKRTLPHVPKNMGREKRNAKKTKKPPSCACCMCISLYVYIL